MNSLFREKAACVSTCCVLALYIFFSRLFDSYLWPLGEQLSFPCLVTQVGATCWSRQVLSLEVLQDSEISSIS